MDAGRKIKVAVEGNIGCGKSTFLKYFGDYSSNIQISPEPIELWNNVKGFKLFEVFYGNPNRWSTAFQSQVMVTLMNRQAERQVAPVRILERSVSSCRYIFIEAMNRNGQLSNADLDVFDKFYSYGRSLPTSDLDLIVYLRCMPEVCANRIRERDRKGESNISMQAFKCNKETIVATHCCLRTQQYEKEERVGLYRHWLLNPSASIKKFTINEDLRY
nr:thymidine kinase [Hymenolepis microstoma]